MWLRNLLGVLGWRLTALRALADSQAVVPGVICYICGHIAAGAIRVSSSGLREAVPLTGLFYRWNLYEWGIEDVDRLLFLLIVFVPLLIALANAFSDDGFGFSFSFAEYRAHLSVLFPIWGFCSPLMALLSIPYFLIGERVIVPLGYLLGPLAFLVYTFWVVKQLNYLSSIRTCGVMALALLSQPLYWLVSAFVFSLPLLLLIPLLYLGISWLRGQGATRSGDRNLRRRLESLTVNPQDADAHYQLGRLHLERAATATAYDYLARAVKIAPQVAEYQYYLGRAAEQKNDWAQALACYEEAYRLDPQYAQGDIFREVGKAYLHTGSIDKAREFLEFFLAGRDADPEGRYWLAVALQKSGNGESMRRQLEQIVHQARNNPRFFRRQNREWLYRARRLLRDSAG